MGAARRILAMIPLAGVALLALVPAAAGPPDYGDERASMVERLRNRGIDNQYVLVAMQRVPRHLFVSPGDRNRAYEDLTIPVGSGQAIYEPYIVAIATQMLNPKPGSKILQVGAGCGYCTAVLCEITPHVYALDLRADIVRLAETRLKALGYSNVNWRNKRACEGWAEKGPFDAIIVTCATDAVPDALVKQLKDGGRLVIPVGHGPEQTLICLKKTGEKIRSEVIMPIRVDMMVCQTPSS